MPYSICAFCYTLELFGIVVFHTSLGELEGGACARGISAFCYMLNLFGLVECYRSMVELDEGYLCPQYMCILLYVQTYLVQQYAIHLWSIAGGGSLCQKYMCILLYVQLILL